MPRRDSATGRYVRTYTITYTRVHPRTGREMHPRHAARTAPEVERIGRLLLRVPEDQLFNLAVIDAAGEDVTFEFAVFQG